ncbi:MAG: hypothetical protein U0996_21925 [Planctomycetaceae bacterium]
MSMPVLNTFVVNVLNGEFGVPLTATAEAENCEHNFDEHGRFDSPDSFGLPQNNVDCSVPSACFAPVAGANLEKQPLNGNSGRGMLSPEIGMEHLSEVNPVTQSIQEIPRGKNLIAKIMGITANDAENWLRRLARLISPKSWETL